MRTGNNENLSLLASVEICETASKEIGKIEKEIDDKEHNIEALWHAAFETAKPVGTDLRKISAALKMVTDMERIGDQATDIGEIMNTGSVHVPVTAILFRKWLSMQCIW